MGIARRIFDRGESAIDATRSAPMMAELHAELLLLFLANKNDWKCFDLGLID